jgi:large subunit ribosomal protein L22
MVAKAEAKYLRISPFKVRPVLPLIKKANIDKATAILSALTNKGAYYLKKVLKSAVANAKHKGYDESKLFISKAIANPGPILKRYRAASFGRASPIKKRMAHILIELDTPEKIIQKGKPT